jgi:hypothetical protein
VRNAQRHDSVEPLVNGITSTTNVLQMWTASLPVTATCSTNSVAPPEKKHLELVISLPEHLANTPTTLKVWNYNGTTPSAIRGVKWMAVLQGDCYRWHGVVSPGSGNTSVDYSTSISIAPDSPGTRGAGPFSRRRWGRALSCVQSPASALTAPAHKSPRGLSHSARAAGASVSPREDRGINHRGATTPQAIQDTPGRRSMLVDTSSSLTDLSDDALLAELQRRGIVLLTESPLQCTATPQPAAVLTPQPTESPAQADASAQLRKQPNKSPNPATERYLPVTDSVVTTASMATMSTAQTAPSTSFGPPQASDSPGTVEPQRKSPEHDAEAVAQELVLSADSSIAQMPGLSMTLTGSLSDSDQLSDQLDAKCRSRPASCENISADPGEDICLADAVKRKGDGPPSRPLQDRGTALPLLRPPAFAADPVNSGTLPGSICNALPRSPLGEPACVPSARVAATAQVLMARAEIATSLGRDRCACAKLGGTGPAMQSPRDSDNLVPIPRWSDRHGQLAERLRVDEGNVLGEFAPVHRGKVAPVSARRREASCAAFRAAGQGLAQVPHNIEKRVGAVPDVAASMVGQRGPPIDLNQSLDSLTFFQRHNRGRLADGAQLDAPASKQPLDPKQGAAAPPLPLLPLPQEHVPQGVLDADVHLPQRMMDASAPLSSMFRGVASELQSPPAAVGVSVPAVAHPNEQEPAFLRAMAGTSDINASTQPRPNEAAICNLLGSPALWPDPAFTIPEEPPGRRLELCIFSTWGDVHYVGLSAIEVFDSKGNLVKLSDRTAQVTADPHSVNVLPESSDDPRVPENLFDGVNCTCSDLHQWLTPFTPDSRHTVTIDLGTRITLGMLRIWNYNKSRIHSQRGVRGLEIRLDGTCIFQGEISQAPGAVNDAPKHAECLVFTQSSLALDAIEVHDAVYEQPAQAPVDVMLADMAMPSAPAIELVMGSGQESRRGVDLSVRPRTAALVACGAKPSASTGVLAQTLTIDVLATWGDESYVGLTALQVLDASGQALPVTERDIDACPRDLNDIPGNSGHDRTLDKLLDGFNVTTDDRHMWLAPCSNDPAAAMCTMTLRLGSSPVLVSALALWNYNKDLEGTMRGIGVVRIRADGHLITPTYGIAVQKAPGISLCDFGCVLPLPVLDVTPPSEVEALGPAMALVAATAEPRSTLQVRQLGAIVRFLFLLGCASPHGNYCSRKL